MSNVTDTLARFACDLRYEDIPQEAVHHAKQLVLDGIGCGLYGSTLPSSRLLASTLAGAPAEAPVTLWGSERRTDLMTAVLVNGYAVDSFETDDVHRDALIHIEPVVIPTSLGLAEVRPTVSGRGMLAAIVAAGEVGARIGLCTGYGMIRRGFHSAALTGSFIAAVTAGKVIGLSAGRIRHAMGISGTFAAGLIAAQRGAMVKAMHLARAAQNGMYGAILAERDFTGIDDILGAEYGGFVSCFGEQPDYSILTSGLGSAWRSTDISIKLYASGASTHTAVDCALEIRRAHGVRPQDIASVHVLTTKLTCEHAGWAFSPEEGPGAARLNIPWCTAVAFVRGEIHADDFLDRALRDPQLVELARRVTVGEEPELNALGLTGRHAVRMKVALKDGRSFEVSEVTSEVGHQTAPKDVDVEDKFHGLADRVVGREAADRIAQAVWNLDAMEDVRELSGLLAQ